MLEELIHEIRKGGPLETSRLAAHLKTTPQMVQAMLETLEQNGHLQIYHACEDACGGCKLKDECTSSSSVRLWQETKK